MELSGTLTCKGSKQQIWAALFNTEVWKKSIPDVTQYQKIGENLYEMSVKADIGPLKGMQTIKIQFSDLNPPESCNFNVQHNLVKSAKGRFELQNMEDTAENAMSLLNYTLNADAGNPIFNAVLDGMKAKIKDGFEELLGRVVSHSQEQS